MANSSRHRGKSVSRRRRAAATGAISMTRHSRCPADPTGSHSAASAPIDQRLSIPTSTAAPPPLPRTAERPAPPNKPTTQCSGASDQRRDDMRSTRLCDARRHRPRRRRRVRHRVDVEHGLQDPVLATRPPKRRSRCWYSRIARFERGAIEVRPIDRHEDQFAIGRLPEQEIGQALLAAGADDEIGIGQIRARRGSGRRSRSSISAGARRPAPPPRRCGAPRARSPGARRN